MVLDEPLLGVYVALAASGLILTTPPESEALFDEAIPVLLCSTIR